MPETSKRILYYRIDTLQYPRNSRIREYLEAQGFTVDAHLRAHRSESGRLLRDLRSLASRSKSVSAIVVSEISLDFVLPAWLMSKIRGVPLIVDGFIGKYETLVADRAVYRPRSIKALVCRAIDLLAVRLARIYLVDTKVRRDLVSATRSTRIVSLPVGAPAVFASSALQPARSLRVLFYGSFLPLHGVDTILKGVALAGRADILLTMVGTADHPGGTADTRRLAEELGISQQVTFLPSMPIDELAVVAQEHDVILGLFGPSEKAGSVIANKVWQGLASGRVVVTREGNGLDEIRKLVGDQLITVPAADADALADALRSLADTRPPGYESTAAVLDDYVAEEFAVFGRELSRLLRE